MSYFILEKHEAYTPPRIKNWYKKIETNPLKHKRSNTTQKYATFPIEDHMQTVFVDLIIHPCLLISKKAMDIVKLYDTTLKFEQLLLYNPQNKQKQAYYLPKLPQLDVLTANSQFNMDKSKIIHAEVDSKKTHQKVLFQVANINHSCILIHLDLIESLLRQGVICMGLKKTTTIY